MAVHEDWYSNLVNTNISFMSIKTIQFIANGYTATIGIKDEPHEAVRVVICRPQEMFRSQHVPLGWKLAAPFIDIFLWVAIFLCCA